MALMFSRLARNYAKSGYFPTDEDTLGRILTLLEPPERGTPRIIDPCAGEGVALAECKAHLGGATVEAYGVEFDRERAWHAKTLLDRVIHGDYQDTVITPKGFGLLFLNPPYGDLVSDKAQTGEGAQGEGRKRLEKLFYQRAVRLLQPGGILVLIVPTYTLDKELTGWISTHCESVVAYRAAVDTFQQAVVVGVRAAQPPDRAETERTRTRLMAVTDDARAEALPEFWPGEPYRVPAASGVIRFNILEMESDQFRDEMRRFPCLWPQFDLHLGRTAKSQRRPLRALSRWHLALALAAGQVAGVVRSNDGQRVYVIKGNTHKDRVVQTTIEETGGGGSTEIRTSTDVFVPVIRALDFTPGSPTFGEALVIR